MRSPLNKKKRWNVISNAPKKKAKTCSKNVNVTSVPVRPVAAVAGCLAPHALEGWPGPQADAGAAVWLGDAGGQRPEHRHRPRVDLHVLDVDLGVEVELGAVKKERVCNTMLWYSWKSVIDRPSQQPGWF